MSASWHLACAIAAILAAVHTIAIVILGVSGLGYQVHPVVTRTAILIAWLSGAVVALWNAGDRAGRDNAEGIAHLAGIRGISNKTLAISQLCAPGLGIAALILVACAPVILASLAAAPSVSDAVSRVASILPLGAFALCVGIVAGPLAGACGKLFPRHGRAWLAAVVLIPWSLDYMITASAAKVGSIPGMLGFLADLISQAGTSS